MPKNVTVTGSCDERAEDWGENTSYSCTGVQATGVRIAAATLPAATPLVETAVLPLIYEAIVEYMTYCINGCLL